MLQAWDTAKMVGVVTLGVVVLTIGIIGFLIVETINGIKQIVTGKR